MPILWCFLRNATKLSRVGSSFCLFLCPLPILAATLHLVTIETSGGNNVFRQGENAVDRFGMKVEFIYDPNCPNVAEARA